MQQDAFVSKITEHYRRVREQITDQVLPTLAYNVAEFEENQEELFKLSDWCNSKLRLALIKTYVDVKQIVPNLGVVSYMLGYVKIYKKNHFNNFEHPNIIQF